uniref:Uncharacterized protein n=1 Tax=Mola mola TaxID=94237 RepID=A0A3Q3W133_MOLML
CFLQVEMQLICCSLKTQVVVELLAQVQHRYPHRLIQNTINVLSKLPPCLPSEEAVAIYCRLHVDVPETKWWCVRHPCGLNSARPESGLQSSSATVSLSP